MRPFHFFICLFFIATSSGLFGQNNTTSTLAVPYCIGITYTAQSGTPGAHALEPGNDYGCLFTTPNPSWYFMKCAQSGDIDLLLSAPQDIDFIIYGPFANYAEILNASGNLQSGNAPMVDCSYSSTNYETPSIMGMNAGEYYLMLVTNYANQVQVITLDQVGGNGSLDCSVYNEFGVQAFSGSVFHDINGNGLMDGNEYTMPGIPLDFQPINITQMTNWNGDFFGYNQTIDTVDYVITANLPNWHTTTANPLSFTLDSINHNIDSLLIGLQPDTLYSSVQGNLIGQFTACVGTNVICVSIQNNGTIDASGNVTVTLDSMLTYLSSTIPLDGQSGNELYFSFNDIPLFGSADFCIYLQPSILLTAGDTVNNLLEIELTDSLSTIIGTASDTLISPVVCSYDPNYKEMEAQNITGLPLIEPTDEITYTIHFQNTGTAPAVDVEILDQLDPQLNKATFSLVSSSHNVLTSIDANGEIQFLFENIYLPDSISNEPASHGFVTYKISPFTSILPNEVIMNTAEIYFDNNAPIITNTTVNTISCYLIPSPFTLIEEDGVILSNITDPNLSFAWFLNGNLIVGANSSSVPTNGINGEFTLVVTNQHGCSTEQKYVLSLGLSDSQEHPFSVAPNPSATAFHFYFEADQLQSLRIYDESGRLIQVVSSLSGNIYTLEGSALEKGIYFVNAEFKDGSVSRKKIIKL